MTRATMPIGLTEAEVRWRWPGAIEALPPGANHLRVSSDDGCLWAGDFAGKSEAVWWEYEQRWSPLVARGVS